MKVLTNLKHFLPSILSLCGLLLFPAASSADTGKSMSQRKLNINNWEIYCTNYGPFVNPQQASGGFWPRGTGHSYIYGAGLWVGARDTLDSMHVAVGYIGQHEFGPCDPFTEGWRDYLTNGRARLYLSTVPSDVVQWPLRQGSDCPVILSQQDSYCKFSDVNPAFTFPGEEPLNIVVVQRSFAWNYADIGDVVFFYFTVKNMNSYPLHDVYLGAFADVDIGNEAQGSANDRIMFDYTRNLTIEFQTEPEPGWDRTGCVGMRFFETQPNNTGDTVKVRGSFPELYHDIPPGQSLGLTAMKVITIDIDPETDVERYQAMAGIDWKTGTYDPYDTWGADMPGDKRFIISSGPSIIGPDSTVTICIGVIAAWDTASLRAKSDLAQAFYDNNFMLAAPPVAPRLAAVSGDGCVKLSWDRHSETTLDSYYEKLEGRKSWYEYYRGTYRVQRDTCRIDSFRIKTGTLTSVVIPRSAQQPINGTDTLESFYSKKDYYAPYDLQGYAVYRSSTLEGLSDPLVRQPVGVLHTGSSGANSYSYDRDDGVQIVLDNQPNIYYTPDTTIYLPKYDTIGTDCGLVYYIEDRIPNGAGFWYGVSAYDYQPDACFTRQCPTTQASDPRDNAVLAYARPEPYGYVPAGVTVRVEGASDVRSGGSGGTVDYLKDLKVIDPTVVVKDSFRLRWGPVTRRKTVNDFLPCYTGALYRFYNKVSSGTGEVTVDSISTDTLWLNTRFGGYYYIPEYDSFYSHNAQLSFGGILFYPHLQFFRRDARIDSVQIVEATGGQRTYPSDSLYCCLKNDVFDPRSCMWQWRGSDFEICWKDTTVVVNNIPRSALTAQVWDMTNNVMVPLETGPRRDSMKQSTWCFNPASTSLSMAFADSTGLGAFGMHICGISLYFNKRNDGPMRRMVWSRRPETGDVWRIHCSGPATPIEGQSATFHTTPDANRNYPHQVSLHQNAPNPFDRSTMIKFQLTMEGPANLRVYNVLGQQVRTLIDGYQRPGYFAVPWNGKDDEGRSAAAGIYFYYLKTGIETKTGRMVLIR